MANHKRLIAWLLAGLILFVTLASGFEIAREAHHVCVGEDCRICVHIAAIRELLRIVTLAVACAAAAAAGEHLRRRIMPLAVRSFVRRSPVLLKVRLLN